MQQHLDIGAAIGEAVLVVADVAHDVARDLTDQLAVDHCVVAVFAEQRGLTTALTGDDDLVSGAERLAAKSRIHQAVVGDAELDIVLDERIEDGIRNLVADLVGMTFGDGLAGKEIVGVWHWKTLPSQARLQPLTPSRRWCFLQRPRTRSSVGEAWDG